LPLTGTNIEKLLPAGAHLDSLIVDRTGKTSVTVSAPGWGQDVQEALGRRFNVFLRYRKANPEWKMTSDGYGKRTRIQVTIP
jgi:hypothetical protein